MRQNGIVLFTLLCMVVSCAPVGSELPDERPFYAVEIWLSGEGNNQQRNGRKGFA